jgi:hypothetical protein
MHGAAEHGVKVFGGPGEQKAMGPNNNAVALMGGKRRRSAKKGGKRRKTAKKSGKRRKTAKRG